MKSPAQTVSLGPWSNGLQNVYDPAMAPATTLVEADNVYIGNGLGVIEPRKGYAPLAVGVHSLFYHNKKAYGIYGEYVSELTEDGARTLSNFQVEGKVTWGILEGDPVLTNSSILAKITNGTATRIGVETPVVSVSSAQTATSATVAVSFVNLDGEEGPLSPTFESGTVQAPAENNIAYMRVYATQATEVVTDGVTEKVYGGDVLYLVAEIAPGPALVSAQTYVGAPIGRPADNMNRARMPGGSYVRYWRGRLLVARGRTLFFSDPLRYGMYDQSAGFVTFESRIDFIESVDTGVFVGLRNNGVAFLAGDTPDQWQRIKADIESAQPGTSMLIPTGQMSLDLTSKPEWVAVWFTQRGFALGLPSGTVIYPQAELLSGLPLGNGSIHFDDDRLIVLSQ
ncbi:MAG: hypothetical protein ACPHEP_04405 [Acidimicrobiales bacterium]